MDDKQILQKFEADFPDVQSDPQALKFAVQDVDMRVTAGEATYDQYDPYRRAGFAARDYIQRQKEQAKASSIVAEMKRSRGQS